MKNHMRWIGPAVACGIGLIAYQSGLPAKAAWTLFTAILCALWWISEALPLGATSLLPIALLPLVGVLTPAQVGQAYGHHLILLLMGGFMLSTAMERSGVHRRLALGMVRLFCGNDPGNGWRLVLGFAVAAATLSMWISNTATSLMLLPIAMAIASQGISDELRTALLLSIAYAASVGGIATPIGTPPNLVFISQYAEFFGEEPGFLEWMQTALPITLVMIPITVLWLTRKLSADQPDLQLPTVGDWRTSEIRTLIVFAVTALLWVTRKEPFGGWSGALELEYANDASVALLAVVAMFIIPSGEKDADRLLDWKTASNIPWGILILFGAGLALAKAFTASSLGDLLSKQLEPLATLPVFVMIGVICLLVTFLTEMTSNTATTALLMPVLAAAAIAAEIDARLMMIPATISASFAFMLPVATAPNSVVFGSGHLTISKMAREGFVLNLIGSVVVTTLCYFLLS